MADANQEFSVFFQQAAAAKGMTISLGNLVGPAGKFETYEECQAFVDAKWNEALDAGAERAVVFVEGNQYATYRDGAWVVATYEHRR